MNSSHSTTGIPPAEALAAFGKGATIQNFVNPDRAATRAEIDDEVTRLANWAGKNHLLIGRSRLAALSADALHHDNGFEHNVLFFDGGTGRRNVLKLTQEGRFGKQNRTPSSYLDRWDLFNRLVPAAAARFIGFTQDAKGRGVIVMSQPFIEGGMRLDHDVAQEMAKRGFEQLEPHGTTYRDPHTGIEIHDAHNGNVIFQRDGTIVPFDVWFHDPAHLLQTPSSPAWPIEVFPVLPQVQTREQFLAQCEDNRSGDLTPDRFAQLYLA
jgi:hypothetical protein